MLNAIFHFLTGLDEFFWGYVAFGLIIVLGSYLTIKNKFFQIREFPSIAKSFFQFMKGGESERGVHPLRAFFASAGGMIGIGNVVGIVTAVQLGGPGALFWVWMAGMIGAIVKYGEIYLGLKYRVPNDRGGYDGGPMYFLKAAFKKTRFLPILAALLLCIYGVEIYQFTVITDSVSSNWEINRFLVIAVLLGLVVYAGLGGVKRLGKICSWMMPIFMVVYSLMALWIIGQEITALPVILAGVFKSAFTGQAAIGGFAGASVILAIQHGIARAAYSGDIGIGYDSIIQAESSTIYPERQARLAILGIFIDNLVCTMSILMVLVTGVWKAAEPIQGSHLVQVALSHYFPMMDLFMPLFLIFCGYTTIIAFFVVGLKCARYLMPRRGTAIFTCYAMSTFVLFTFVNQTRTLLVMSIAGAMLLIINIIGIYRLRHEIVFSSEAEGIEARPVTD
ncbi:MAG: Amino-acid carrier protein AlsT [Chlamydiae bacterium]|nr:Amino-acid carrier protein AlsT [Chlamydiota bacterium]